MRIFSKSFDEIAKEDIDELINEDYPEDLFVEYKRKLSKDTWQNNQKGIAKKSKEKLAEEIIAFANTDGGILIVGIKESEDNPPKADSIYCIPNVADLADRIRRSIYDLVEPKIPNLKAKGIPVDGNNGVLIIKVEKSYQAPHRAIFNKECYQRRNDEKIPMTMREIKELTLKSTNVFKNVQKRFKEQSERFKNDFRNRKIPFNYNLDSSDQIGFRITILPISEQVLFPKVFRKVMTYDTDEHLKIKVKKNNIPISTPVGVNKKRPILRGVLLHGTQLNIEIRENGLIEYKMVLENKYKEELFIHGDWFVAYFYKAIALLEKIKDYYDYFDNEFIIEAEIVTNRDQFLIGPAGATEGRFGTPIIKQSNVIFPQYSYQGKDEIEDTLNILNDDIANLCGQDIYSDIELLSKG
jgi:hypothetical protein